MQRLLICLPLVLFLGPTSPEIPPSERPLEPVPFSTDPLPVADPLEFLERCLERYRTQNIRGYQAILKKQERINGKLNPSEQIEVCFQEDPHKVLFRWIRGQRLADAALYAEGENDGKMLAKPSGLAGRLVKYVSRDVEGPDARQSGRYTLNEFGLKKSTERLVRDWKAARDKGSLEVEYLGIRKVREAGDRLCYALRRTCAVPERDGMKQITVYFDKETWLQVGSVLKGEDNSLIGEYMFREVKINPAFPKNQFRPEILTQ